MFGVISFDYYKFIEELPKSNKGWRLSLFIMRSFDVIYPEHGPTPTHFALGGEPFARSIFTHDFNFLHYFFC